MILLVFLLISWISKDDFFTHRNISDLLLMQMTPVGIMSMGMLMVVISGGIDLSVGAVLAMSSVLLTSFTLTMPVSIALMLTIIIGLLAGAVTGYLVAGQQMAPFVATLALMTITRGVAYVVSRGSSILLGENGAGLKKFARSELLYLPKPVWIMLLVAAVVWFIVQHTVFGRRVIGIGSSEDSARISGVRVAHYKFLVYCIASGLAAISGILITSQTGVGTPIFGMGAELDVITAVVFGGASLRGGKGSVLNTMLSVCILGILENMMNLMNVPGYPQQIIKGIIIIFAVLVQRGAMPFRMRITRENTEFSRD